jgi:hypothetical protein
MQTVLRGARFRPFDAQLILLKLKAGDRLRLVPEPDNRFDPNAIQVLGTAPGDDGAPVEAFIGYIAKEDCEDVHSMLAVGVPIKATILEENGNSPSIQIEHDFDAAGPEAA